MVVEMFEAASVLMGKLPYIALGEDLCTYRNLRVLKSCCLVKEIHVCSYICEFLCICDLPICSLSEKGGRYPLYFSALC